MGRTKNYRSALVSSPDASHNASPETLNSFPLVLNYSEMSGGKRNPTSTRNLDLTHWAGGRLEPWARAWMRTLTHLLQDGGPAVASCVKFGIIHDVFFRFLIEPRLLEPPCAPGDLLPRHVIQFRLWLTTNFRPNTALNYYRNVKSMIVAMIDLGLVNGYPDEFFPRNTMQRSPPGRAATALSDAELQRLVAALKRDLIALHKGTFEDSARGAMTVYFLVLAMRTGGNPTPLLELTRADLKPHLLPGMMRIDLVKHRSGNTYPAALREKQSFDEVISVPMDGVAILNRVIEATKGLVERASDDLKDRVWLYDSSKISKVLCLNQAHIDKAIPSFVRRHELRSDDGERLILNLSRLRKNKAQQLFKMSGGDLATVALLLGNTPRVAGQNYMNMTAQLRAEGAVFVGEVLEVTLAGEAVRSPDDTPVETTPVARCKDSLGGMFAPKDGVTHCDQFIHCLGCPSFAIAGTLSDLHRLFSFQAFLKDDIDYYPADDEFDEWRAHRQRLIELIDEFVTKEFAPKLVSEARALTAKGLHRYWAIQLQTIQRLRGLDA